MGRKKISTTVYLTEQQVDALKALHSRTRVPIAEYIRTGIDMVLDKHRENLPGQISLFEEVGQAKSPQSDDKKDPSEES